MDPLPSTNFDKWQLFMKDVVSPQSYVDVGFYYLIAAALQRRVWEGGIHGRLYPNIYPILVGKPGIGKGEVLKQVASILREHKIDNIAKHSAAPSKNVGSSSPTPDPTTKDVSLQDLLDSHQGQDTLDTKKLDQLLDKPLVIPVAANATTFEALVSAMAKSTRRIKYVEWDEALQQHTVKPYSHCSLCFCLGEIASLFRKKTEDVVNFLLEAYDCGDRYEYDTRTKGRDVVRMLCLNFLGGTTPDFMEAVFDDAILNQGFSSRAWFIFAHENRHYNAFPSDLSPEQIACRVHLVEHVRKLTKLYGPIQYTPEARAFIKHEVEEKHGKQGYRQNYSPKLEYYYARWVVHLKKMTIILHASELDIQEPSDPTKPLIWDNVVTIDTCKKAASILRTWERAMHMALTFGGNNPLYKVGQKILRFLATKPEGALFHTILAEHWEYAQKAEIEEIMTMLVGLGKVDQEPQQNNIVLYRIASKKDEGGTNATQM